MSDDPLRLTGLDAEAIEKSVGKRTKKAETEESKMRADTNAKREDRLQTKDKTGPGPPPTQATPAPEPPPKDRSLLLDKLGNYRERFPELKSRNKISGKSSVEEIEDDLHYVEQQLGTKDGNLASNIFVAAMAGVEHVTQNHFNPLGLNLNGLGAVSRDNIADIQPILDELVIKYGASMYMSPEMRLVTTVGTMVYTVHAANSGDPATAQVLEKMKKTMKPVATDL